MKKNFALLLFSVFFIALCLTACTTNSSKELDSNNTVTNNNKDVELVDQFVIDQSNGYWKTGFKIKNNSDQQINTVEVIINELDENGDIISTTGPQEPTVVEPGQSITIDGLHKVDLEIKSVQAISVTYYTGVNTNGTYNTCYLDGSQPLLLE